MSYPTPPPYSWHTVNSSQTVNSIPTHVGRGCAVKTPPLGLCANNTVSHPGIPGLVMKMIIHYTHSIIYGVMLN